MANHPSAAKRNRQRIGRTLRNKASTLGNVQYAEPDDDIHYTILGLMLIEKHGLNFARYDVAKGHLDNIPYHWLWSCTRQSYYHMVNMTDDRPVEEQIAEYPTKLNPWREGINAAIRADFWGYVSPGDPRRAAKIAHREVSFNTVKNGSYSSMFVAGCLAAALSKNPTVDTILQGGLSVIPQQSRLARITAEVQAWYAQEGYWLPVCDRVYERYGHLPFLAALHNMAFVVLALIHGQLDFEKAHRVPDPKPFNLTLKKGEKALFKYRVAIYEGNMDKAKLDALYQSYAK